MVHAVPLRSYWDGGYYYFDVNQLNASEAGGSENFFLHVTVSRLMLVLDLRAGKRGLSTLNFEQPAESLRHLLDVC